MEPVGLDFRVAGKNGEECTGVGVDRFAAVHYGMREGGNVDRFFVRRAERFAVAAMGMEMAFFLFPFSPPRLRGRPPRWSELCMPG
jgi:hypothetical protein